MRFRFEKRFVLIFLFIFLLLLSQSIYLYIQDLNGSVGYEKLVVRLKEKLPAEKGFNIGEVSGLNRIISAETEMFTYYAFNDLVVSSSQGSRQIQVFGVLENYDEFNRVQIIKGSFIDDNDNRLKKNVAVIEDVAAESLFRSENVIGLEMEIYNKKFVIIGVISTKGTKIEKLLGTKNPGIYIPLNTMNDLNPYTYIGNLEYSNSGRNLDIDSIVDKVAFMGKATDDFIIEDLNIVGTQQKQKYNILFFVLGIYSLYLLVRLISNIVKYIISYSKSSLNEHYFFSMIKNGIRIYIKASLTIFLIIIIGIFIWNRISFSFYMAPDKIPDNPGSIIQVINMLTRYITEFINYYYTYPVYIIEVSNFLQKINSIVFFLGLIFEILFLSSMKRGKSDKIEDDVNFLFNIGVYLIISILLSVTLIYLLGLPVMVSIVNILLIWISFTIISFSHQGGYLRLLFGDSEEIQGSIEEV